MESFLHQHVYRHPTLLATREIAHQQLHRLFVYFVTHPQQLPPRFSQRIEHKGLPRAVGDYLAGMTDRYLEISYLEQFPDDKC